MVYFILQHPAPNDIGVVRPQMYFPEDQLLKLIHSRQAWCVLDVTGIETQVDIENRQGLDRREKVRSIISRLADEMITIPPPSREILGQMYMYVRHAQ
jgi:hypothetical protein